MNNQTLVLANAPFPTRDGMIVQQQLNITGNTTLSSPPRSPHSEHTDVSQHRNLITTTQGDGGQISTFHAQKNSTLIVYSRKEVLLRVHDVSEYTLVPASNLYERKTILVCVCQPSEQRSTLVTFLIDGNNKTTYQMLVSMDVPKDLLADPQNTGEKYQESVDMLNSALQRCMLSSCESHVCMYVPSRTSIYLWNLSLRVNTSEGISSYSCDMKLATRFDVFASVFCMIMTDTHIVLGKLNCIHIYNWKYVQKKMQHKETNQQDGRNDLEEQERIIRSESMGRCIYLPRTATKAKRNLNKAFEQLSASGNAPAVNVDEKNTIKLQESEKVVCVKKYLNGKFVISTGLGNIYLLNCIMPFDKDLLVKLSFPCHLFEHETDRTVCFDLLSCHLEPILQCDGGLMAVVMKGASESIHLTRAKGLFDAIEAQKNNVPPFIEMNIHSSIHHHTSVTGLVFQDKQGLFVVGKDEMSLYKWKTG
ncbi:hypothetical protein AKO1_000317 [Acrasis kona]|uniref:Uncharacterized protein n=1 Tax=Acrasis kona TaxID=1008807 RepID=A0AAW2ZG04_9EUKA